MPDESQEPTPAPPPPSLQVEAVLAASAEVGRQFRADMDRFIEAANEVGRGLADALATAFESEESQAAVRAVLDQAGIRLRGSACPGS